MSRLGPGNTVKAIFLAQLTNNWASTNEVRISAAAAQASNSSSPTHTAHRRVLTTMARLACLCAGLCSIGWPPAAPASPGDEAHDPFSQRCSHPLPVLTDIILDLVHEMARTCQQREFSGQGKEPNGSEGRPRWTALTSPTASGRDVRSGQFFPSLASSFFSRLSTPVAPRSRA
jgi:hypothetical protein